MDLTDDRISKIGGKHLSYGDRRNHIAVVDGDEHFHRRGNIEAFLLIVKKKHAKFFFTSFQCKEIDIESKLPFALRSCAG